MAKRIGFGDPIDANMTAEICPLIEKSKNLTNCLPAYEKRDSCSFTPRDNGTFYGKVSPMWRSCNNSTQYYNSQNNNTQHNNTNCTKTELCYCDFRNITTPENIKGNFLNCLCNIIPSNESECTCNQILRVECSSVRPRTNDSLTLSCNKFFHTESMIEYVIQCNDSKPISYSGQSSVEPYVMASPLRAGTEKPAVTTSADPLNSLVFFSRPQEPGLNRDGGNGSGTDIFGSIDTTYLAVPIAIPFITLLIYLIFALIRKVRRNTNRYATLNL